MAGAESAECLPAGRTGAEWPVVIVGGRCEDERQHTERREERAFEVVMPLSEVTSK